MNETILYDKIKHSFFDQGPENVKRTKPTALFDGQFRMLDKYLKKYDFFLPPKPPKGGFKSQYMK